MKNVNIALLGFGTVGKGTYQTLVENQKLINQRFGVKITVKKILEVNEKAVKASGLPKSLFTANYDDILNDKDISIVAEMLGGIDIATKFMLAALKAGKNVVSSNKAALAANMPKLAKAAKANKVQLLYEASVCGAIPVMSTISGNLGGNKFNEIRGIVNGTSNFILTQMMENDMSYADALKKAQELGFAEADPTADVEGIDAANKICLLANLAMNYYQDPTTIKRTGITKITAKKLAEAKAKNCKIKLIAKAKQDKDGVSLSVKPELIQKTDILYNVDYEFNGITLSTDCAKDIFLYGRGAGSLPTGSAVAGDIIKIASCLS